MVKNNSHLLQKPPSSQKKFFQRRWLLFLVSFFFLRVGFPFPERGGRERPLKAFKGQDHQSHIMSHMVFGSTPMVSSLPQVAMDLQKHIMQQKKIAANE